MLLTIARILLHHAVSFTTSFVVESDTSAAWRQWKHWTASQAVFVINVRHSPSYTSRPYHHSLVVDVGGGLRILPPPPHVQNLCSCLSQLDECIMNNIQQAGGKNPPHLGKPACVENPSIFHSAVALSWAHQRHAALLKWAVALPGAAACLSPLAETASDGPH